MIGLAANDDAQRHERVIGFGGIGDRDRAGYFQRAGDGDRLVGVARRLDRGTGAGQKQVVQMVVEARLDDQDRFWGMGGHVYSSMRRSPTIDRP